MLNMIIMAEETLAYGGTIAVRAADKGCRFEIQGRNAHLSELIQAAFEGATPIEELTPRSIQAYVTGKFAEHFGLKLTHDQSVTDRLDIGLTGTAIPVQIQDSLRIGGG